MNAAPALYVGTVRHRRFQPTPHQFRYQLFMVLLDVDRLAEAMSASRLTSYNRWNWAAFHDRDHIGDPAAPLRHRLRDSAAAAGAALPDGPILLLTHLRYAGYIFNPISIYYCHDSAGDLRVVMADVRNTYGGRTQYWLRPESSPHQGFRAAADKSLYVSPFMAPDVRYEFLLTPPGPSLVAHMNVNRIDRDPAAPRLFDATLTLRRQPWTATTVRRTLLRFPWMTASVIAAIHWQALRLRLKGLPIFPRS